MRNDKHDAGHARYPTNQYDQPTEEAFDLQLCIWALVLPKMGPESGKHRLKGKARAQFTMVVKRRALAVALLL